MAAKPMIVMGDKTSHGGSVVMGTPLTTVDGKMVARVGDLTVCPIPGHGNNPIVTGDPTMVIDGQPVARHGDKTACGAVLISGLQFTATVDMGGGGGGGGDVLGVESRSAASFAGGNAVPMAPSKKKAADRSGASTANAATQPAAPKQATKVSAAQLDLPNTPADAPQTIDLSPLNGGFDQQWQGSLPGGVAQEQGGTLVSDSAGNLSMVNAKSGDTGFFTPDLNVGPDQTVRGIFHTHPYDATEGGFTGVSLSGGDAGYLINSGQSAIVAQSGSEQFMYLRTAATPNQVDADLLNNLQNDRIEDLTKTGVDFSSASQIAAKETAQKLGLAYYEGTGGSFARIYP